MGDDRRIEELKRAARRNPDAPELKTELLRALFRADRFEEARKLIVRELRQDRLRHALRILAWEQARLLLDDGPWPTELGDPYNRRLSPRQGARRGRVAVRLRVGASYSARLHGSGGLDPESATGFAAASDERVFIVTSEQRLIAFDAHDWSRAWERTWPEQLRAPSVDLAGHLFVQSRSAIAILDPDSGEPLTGPDSIDLDRAKRGEALGAAMPTPEGFILSSRSRGLELHEARRGELARALDFTGRLRTPPVLLDDLIMAFAPTHRLLLFERGGDLRDELSWSVEEGYLPKAHLIYDPRSATAILSQPRREHVDAHSLLIRVEEGRFARRTQSLRRVEALALDSNGRALIRLGRHELCWLKELRKQEGLGRVDELEGVAVDAAGIAFIAADGALRAIAPGGHRLFELSIPAPLSCGPVIGPRGTVLLGLRDGIVLVID